MADSEELSFSTCVRGYHIYKDIWTPKVGETFAMLYGRWIHVCECYDSINFKYA